MHHPFSFDFLPAPKQRATLAVTEVHGMINFIPASLDSFFNHGMLTAEPASVKEKWQKMLFISLGEQAEIDSMIERA